MRKNVANGAKADCKDPCQHTHDVCDPLLISRSANSIAIKSNSPPKHDDEKFVTREFTRLAEGMSNT